MSAQPKVAVVILNWNGKKHLGEFLPSVLASTWLNLDIIVGDNGSTDGSVEFLQQNFAAVKIIQNDQNYGFSGGYNRLLEKVDADYLFLLNKKKEKKKDKKKQEITLMESDPLIAVASSK